MRAVFLDRDGVINNGELVHSLNQLKLFDNAADAIKILNALKMPVIVITNQPVVARGLCDEDMVKRINQRMVDELAKKGAKIDAVYYCPHHPERQYGGNLAYRVECKCRKPKTGMLEQAASDFGLDLTRCFFIGDSMRDMKTAQAVSCRKILVKTGHAGSDAEFKTEPDFLCNDIKEAALLVKKLHNMKALILAGGLGTRMRGVTKDQIPKVLLQYNGKTILEQQIEFLKKYGIESVILCTCFRKEVIKNFLANKNLGMKIVISEENEPLGTGGAVKNARNLVDETFLMLYGDLAVDMNLNKLLDFHFSKKGLLTIVLHESDHPYDSDLVEVDESGLVKSFLGKPDPNKPLPTKLTKTSIYVVEPAVFDFMPEKGSFEDVAIPAIIENHQCFGYVTEELVRDIGTPDRYEKARK